MSVVVSCCRSGVPTLQPRGTRGTRGTRGSPSVLHALDALDALDGIDGTDGTVVSLVSQLGIATWHDLRFLPCGYHVARRAVGGLFALFRFSLAFLFLVIPTLREVFHSWCKLHSTPFGNNHCNAKRRCKFECRGASLLCVSYVVWGSITACTFGE